MNRSVKCNHYNYEDFDTLEQAKNTLIAEYTSINPKPSYYISLLNEIDEELEDENENVARCNEIIHEVVEYLNSRTLKYKSDMVCPLCGEEYVYYYEIPKETEGEYTYVYVCEDCPFVSLELIDDEDMRNFNSHTWGF